ncbi:MAG TPA: ABC transporter permease [Chloroflexia bacterium]|nr:ABC transporter permease [Chloroflexia bacterium]
MATYILRRVLAMIPALLGISLITFVLMHMTRGGPFSSERGNAAVTAALNLAYGLTDPLWPAFYGDAAYLQGVVGVVGAVLLVLGIGLNVWSRRRIRHALPNSSEASSALTWQQLARFPLIIGGVMVVWWLVMFVQGPVTQLAGSGFAPGQYLRFLWNVSHGDLGPSFTRPGQQVTTIILSAASNSLVLGIAAFLLLIFLGVPLGILAAVKHNTWIDYAASTFSLVGYSIPNFVMGILLILATGVWLRILPIAHWGDPIDLLLPAFVLAIRPMAVLTRLTRASMLEVLNQDYIRTAWAKGLSGRAVLIRHALRNALLPVVTVMGDQLGDLVTGSLVVETLFAVPGIGQFFVNSVAQRDYGMIMGTTLFYAGLVLGINLVVDLLYGVIDPRVRLGAGSRS